MKYVDLHTHTIFSDGTDDSASIVRASRLKGIDVLAITDHDTLAGYFQAKDLANRWNIQLLPGVEVSTDKYHILGLNINPHSQEFLDFLAKIRKNQRKTCENRIELLRNHGVPISIEKLDYAFPESRLGKWNILMALVQDQECWNHIQSVYPGATPDEIFTKYMRKGGIAATVQKYDVPPREAIDQIHKAGGIAVIAHPFKDVDRISELDILVQQGIDGLEVQPNYGERNLPFVEYARSHGLKMSYGSDYHGPVVKRALLERGENRIENLEEFLSR